VAKKKKKLRTGLRKNRSPRSRVTDWTRQFESHGFEHDDTASGERLTGKGELTRKRTIQGEESPQDDAGLDVVLDVDVSYCLAGRVVAVFGLNSHVKTKDGKLYRCAVRRLLKTLSTDQRHVVAAGDQVLFRPSGEDEGVIERIQPRRGVLSRESRGRQHVIVANVDQMLIVTSAAEPRLKPNLIDRFLVTAEKCQIRPVICINKIDLVDAAQLAPLVGVYSQMGYRVLLVSAATGFGIDRLRRLLSGAESVVAGQSGVGKSSLLNAVDPDLELAVSHVSTDTQKGRHTTTTARLLPLACGGYVVDTPGIRQMQLWDVIPTEVAGYYRDLRPLENGCRYPDCTHTHEEGCAVKNAVADGWLDARRYESYCHLFEGDAF